MVRILENIGLERIYFNIVKSIYEKWAANIIQNQEKLEAIPLNSGTRQ